MILRSKTVLQNIWPVKREKNPLKKRKQNKTLTEDGPAAKKVFKNEITTCTENKSEEKKVHKEFEFDFDSEESQNIESVSEYAMDIFKYYKSRELKFRVSHYIPNHPELSVKARTIAIDWLVGVHGKFSMNDETLYGSVKLMDLYLTKTTKISIKDLQKIACCAFFIATKFQERYSPSIDDLIYLSGDDFTRDEFVKMEQDMLKAIGFDIGAPLGCCFLGRLARVTRVGSFEHTLAKYILETTLLNYEFSLISSSRMASSCFMLAMKMVNSKFVWGDVLVKYSGYDVDDLKPLLPKINHTLHSVKKSPLRHILDKYLSKKFYNVAKIAHFPDTMAPDFVLPEMSSS
uniref:G2/mitotic-specific cyclin-B3 n=1 Tax=Caenorhabditis japonica TaxID=281687 RepID=A0A8R1DKF3_CAEJA